MTGHRGGRLGRRPRARTTSAPGTRSRPIRVAARDAPRRATSACSTPTTSPSSPPVVIDDDLLATVHDPDYIAAVQRVLGRPDRRTTLHRGLGTDDVPDLPRACTRPRARSCGATLAAARAVVRPGDADARGQPRRRPAPRDARRGVAASASTTTSRSRSSGCSTRASSGSPTSTSTSTTATASQAAFWDDPRVLTDLAARVGPRRSSPAPASRPRSAARTPSGYAVNVALPPGTGDDGWLRAFHGVVPPLLRSVRARTSSSPSRAATPTPTTRSRTSRYRRRPARCLRRAARARARVTRRPLGRHSAAAATRWSTSSRGPGRTSSASSSAHPSPPETPLPGGVARLRRASGSRCRRPALMTDGRTPRVALLGAGLRPRRRRSTAPSCAPARPSSRSTASTADPYRRLLSPRRCQPGAARRTARTGASSRATGGRVHPVG